MRIDSASAACIDKSKPISFIFAGRRYDAFEGDTLASALIANGEVLLSRSFKYHRPRGALNDGGSRRQYPGSTDQFIKKRESTERPNLLADKILLRDGDVFDAQNYAGSLYKDKGQITEYLARFLPVGFYYKTFFRPVLGFFDKKKRDSWPLWEPLIRKQAGLGRLDLKAKGSINGKRISSL